MTTERPTNRTPRRSARAFTALAMASASILGTFATTASAAAPQSPAPAPATATATAPGTVNAERLGFNALLWSYTRADPTGAYRLYYYNKCKPKAGVRFMRMKTSWIYTTYECWAILA